MWSKMRDNILKVLDVVFNIAALTAICSAFCMFLVKFAWNVLDFYLPDKAYFSMILFLLTCSIAFIVICSLSNVFTRVFLYRDDT